MNDGNTKYRTSDGSKLSPKETARLDEIEAHSGGSDEIPETSDSAWHTAVRGKHAGAKLEAVSIQLDAEVLAWVRRRGPSSSVAINRILREKMEAESQS